MKWTGKIIGGVLGLLSRNPRIFLFAIIIGHLYDMGLFSGASAGNNSSAPPPASAPSDPYAILGVSSSDNMETIEQAYRRMISEYHPDRVANAASEIRDLAERRAREINTAYETIQQQRRKG